MGFKFETKNVEKTRLDVQEYVYEHLELVQMIPVI